MATWDQRRLLALCALRVDDTSPAWSALAREAERHGGLDRLYRGEVCESSRPAEATRQILRRGLEEDLSRAQARVDQELEFAERAGAQLITVLDDGYPANLRLIADRPPFLIIRGRLHDEDARAVAVVGTRKPSPDGLTRASKMAARLAEESVTVVSGLAAGIDTVAHRAALDASGRTIAVIGTGITRTYPKENKALAEEIAEKAAIVSQFWPSTTPATYTFPRRNAVMSGIAQGTVVIEASKTSGAKMQARLTIEQGKRVWLVRSLVTNEPWAQLYVCERGAREVCDVEQVIHDLAAPERIAEAGRASQQLALEPL